METLLSNTGQNQVGERAHNMLKRDKLMNIGMLVGIAFLMTFVFYGYRRGIFSSVNAFEAYVAGFGVWEAIVFIMIQIVQVVVPFLPSSIGCVVGIVLFGPWIGFLYNYVAICIGSVIDFLLSKKYGTSFVRKMVGKKQFDKYITLAKDNNRFEKMFAAAIFFPGAPDDFLCYIAGLTPMRLRKFIIIILLGKPLSIAIFSLGTSAVLHLIFSMFK